MDMQTNRRGAKPAWQKRIAEDRIKRLFELAAEDFRKKPENANRYIKLARKIAMRYNIKFSRDLRKRFCRNCSAYLKPGVNSRARTDKNTLITKCMDCGNIERLPLKKK
jgi:ribonuclease P protein subunit RPR2